jgi:hypothetical protein
MPESDEMTHCASCGARVDGPWCGHCGERLRKPGELSLSEYLREFFEDLTNLNGKLWGSLRALVFSPGELTTEYMRGRRVPWMRPLHIFLLINLLYFLLSGWNTFNTPLYAHMSFNNFPHKTVAINWTNRAINDPAMADEPWRQIVSQMHTASPNLDDQQQDVHQRLREYASEFDRKTDIYARTLIISLIPLMTLLPWLVFLRRREGPVRHLVFATHWMSWFVLLSIPAGMITIGLISLGLVGHQPLIEELISSGLIVSFMLLWSVPAFRRVYRLGWTGAGLAALAMTFWLVLALNIYRSILFFVVHWSI